MKNFKELFIQNGIPYDDIDEEIRETIYLLNFKYGLKTKYCCSGHGDNDRFYIMFDEGIDDKRVGKLAEMLLGNIEEHLLNFKINYNIRAGECKKRGRILFKNWILESTIERQAHKRRIETICAINNVLKTN